MRLFLYVVICLIWGTTWIAIKIGLSQAPPLYTSSLRFILAVLLLALIVQVKKYSYPGNWKDFLRLGYPGLYMYGVSYALIYFSELYIDSALAAIVFASFPFFVALLSWLMLQKEKLKSLEWLGLLLGLVGVVLISVDSLHSARDIFLGTLLALGGTGAAAYGMLLHKEKFSDTNIYIAATVQMLCGGVLLILPAVFFEDWSSIHFTFETVGSIIYLALFGSVIAFLAYYWLLARSRAITVALIAFITPLVAIFIGVIFFQEKLSLLVSLGTVLILSGVLLVERR